MYLCTCIASGSVDFTFIPRSITFAAGETEYIIDVEINDDNIFELGNETFSMYLSSVQSPESLNITITDDITTVVILDDDRKYHLFVITKLYTDK